MSRRKRNMEPRETRCFSPDIEAIDIVHDFFELNRGLRRVSDQFSQALRDIIQGKVNRSKRIS